MKIKVTDTREHRLDRETDYCRCGGQWLYYEAGTSYTNPPPGKRSVDLPGVYGCEKQGHLDALEHNYLRDTNDRLTIDRDDYDELLAEAGPEPLWQMLARQREGGLADMIVTIF